MLIALVVIGGLTAAALVAVSHAKDNSGIASPDLKWTNFVHSTGRFRLEMPGEAQERTVEVPSGFGGRTNMDVVSVNGSEFVASVSVYADAVPDGMDFAKLPFSPEGAEAGVEANGFNDAQVVSHKIIAEKGNRQMDVELVGRVKGDDAVMVSRLIIAGNDMYEVSIAGKSVDRGDLIRAHERMGNSFLAPTG